MPQKRVKASQFNKGLKTTPGSTAGGWQAAAEMENLKVDENGSLILAGQLQETEIELEGTGLNLEIFHWPGIPRTSLTPITKYYRTKDKAVNIGRRAFFASRDGRPKWIDMVTNQEYEWEMNTPQQASTLRKTISPVSTANIYNQISNINITPNPVSYTHLRAHSPRD